MITREQVTIGDRDYLHTFSDTFRIRKVGTDEIYDDALDTIPCPYEYEETDEPLDT